MTTKYWLIRAPGWEVEGPYEWREIDRRWAQDLIDERAMVRLDGTDDWRPVREELEWHAAARSQHVTFDFRGEGWGEPEVPREPLLTRKFGLREWLCSAVLVPPIIWGIFSGVNWLDARSYRYAEDDDSGQAGYRQSLANANFELLKEKARMLGGSVSGEAGGTVYINVPGPVDPYDARTLANEARDRVGGIVRVRDGSGKVVASASAFGVQDGR